MSLLSVKVESLTEAAGEFGAIITDMRAHEKRLDQLLHEIDASWLGTAKAVFIAKMRGEKRKIASLISYLTMLRAYSEKTANTMRVLDQLLKKLLSAIGAMGRANTNPDTLIDGDGNLKVYPSLNTHMSGSMNQYSYSAFTEPYGYNAGCCATAYATGLSIVNGRSYDPTQFWYGGSTHYDAGGLADYASFDTNAVYASLLAGKPSMCHFGHNLFQDGQHWVLIKGVRQGADVSQLSYRDFIAVDPATGTERTLAEMESKYTGFNLWGMQRFA